ncbi:MAG: hypoxanthine phosphoribosyltransferase [Ruminococcaceae bacterium]|nr:hypoxanthine phosphoribosyltransferase [Oscillospiraceae bacterium]
MNKDIESILVNESELDALTERLAARIDEDYRDTGRPLVMVCILKGSVMFYVDLIKKIRRPVEMEFMKVSSYGAGTASSGCINLHLDLKRTDYPSLDVILVEDIVDSGRTLSMLTALFRERKVHSIATCTMLDKPSRREVDFAPDYAGLSIPDKFVVGYGLDYNEYYRDLPYVGILKPEVYTNH